MVGIWGRVVDGVKDRFEDEYMQGNECLLNLCWIVGTGGAKGMGPTKMLWTGSSASNLVLPAHQRESFLLHCGI